jgi:hypothetical protein
MIYAVRNMKDCDMTGLTQSEMAEDFISLMQDIHGRMADRRTNQMFGIPTARISKELELKLGRLSVGLGDPADRLERDG